MYNAHELRMSDRGIHYQVYNSITWYVRQNDSQIHGILFHMYIKVRENVIRFWLNFQQYGKMFSSYLVPLVSF